MADMARWTITAGTTTDTIVVGSTMATEVVVVDGTVHREAVSTVDHLSLIDGPVLKHKVVEDTDKEGQVSFQLS